VKSSKLTNAESVPTAEAGRKRAVRPSAILQVPMPPEMKEIIGALADEEELAMNEWVVLRIARIIRRPDLAKVPRKPFGRPRKRPPTENKEGG
jgi:hypothetical protein